MNGHRAHIGSVGLIGALLLAGCSPSPNKFAPVSPDLSSPTTVPVPTTAPALIPFAGEGFRISLPGPGTMKKKTVQSATGPVEISMVTVTSGVDAYNVSYNTVTAKRPDLDAVTRASATGAQGTLADVRSVTFKGFTGRDYRVANAHNQVTVFVRVLLVGKRIFQIQGAFEGDFATPPDDRYHQVLESFTAA